jgi:hypothetical protein
MEHRWNENDRTDPGSNPGLRGEGSATNRLTHGTASFSQLQCILYKNFPVFLSSIVLQLVQPVTFPCGTSFVFKHLTFTRVSQFYSVTVSAASYVPTWYLVCI